MINKSKALGVFIFILISSVLFALHSKSINHKKCVNEKRVGSYYYPWFTLARWKKDSEVLGRPLMGFYDGSSSEVIAQHIDWARYSGISYFVYSWLGTDFKAHSDEIKITNKFLRTTENHGMKVSALYETAIALAQNESPLLIDFEKEMPSGQIAGEKFVNDMVYFAERASNSSNHLKEGNCPKISLYLVRNFVNAEPYFKKLKQRLNELDKCLNMNADIIFWHDPNTPLFHNKKSSRQQWQWIASNFSGIFGYNLYSSNLKTYRAKPKETFTKFYLNAKDMNQVEWKRRAKSAGVKYIYSVQPGYDDRTLRGSDRPAIEPSVDFFLKDWGRIIKRMEEDEHVIITSFNEWYEGTAIEPDIKNKSSLLEANKNVIESINNYICK